MLSELDTFEIIGEAIEQSEAISSIRKLKPDVVLLDIMMPKIDGFEVCRRLREWSPTPIIVLSVRGDERDKVKCLDLGADDYVTKPFRTGELLARIKIKLRRAGVISSD